ncbi:MAG: chemotaxis protein CheW [gamma proteobacterium symbiont of Bathyaustriella thionipta]|nr:chemotaxis protein CheW [gamma proteobacterium symbiont of Bathyaustriella thionipta]MCU7950342.1 chemotaxis protein CheW [gamma proteobacterium symbiont of Bathyaustriella thionipta]MCU7952963.1 chemotaxis protein CheW [gamma proteobacterium symbiont of Bathyaustriella thionipta]MCU7956872.1 chemotaxis protein CheW [gamma proteobacterium symbiont of Bathyaustriella thionipta]MCU7967225.1 chemotaxis protein CheW [gamma proteobacterium symbiont of Bathyaustriella thionipta]
MEYDYDDNLIVDPLTQWVTFMLDGEKYGIDVMQVREVLRDIEIAPVPGAPSYVLGIINLRGNVVTVIDTRSRFGLQTVEPGQESRIIIIETMDQTLGLLVDSIAEVADILQSQIELTPNVGNDESSRYIQGVHNRDGELLILVSVEKVLNDEEWAEMDMF